MEDPISADDFSRTMGRIAAKAWSDAEFKKKLLADPAAIAQEFGLPVPSGIELRVVEDSPTVRHFVLPPRPNMSELSDEQLDQVAGGASVCSTTGLSTVPTVCSTTLNCGSCACGGPCSCSSCY
jgi:hypothetical protein